jgi:hypothetical protein
MAVNGDPVFTALRGGSMLASLIDDADHIFLEAKSGQISKLRGLLMRCHGQNQVDDAF